MSKFIRELGNTEYFFYLYDKIASTNFSVIIELKKSISIESLKKSINLIVNSYEIFCTKIVASTKTKLYFEKNDKTDYDIISKSGSAESLTSIIEEEINTPIKNGKGSLRVIYFTDNTDNKVYMIFTFNHTLTDAIAGIKISQNIILYAYDSNAKPYKQAILPSLEQLFPKSTKGFTFFRSILRFIIKNIKFTKKYRKPLSLEESQYNFNSRNIKIYKIVISENDYKPLIENCKKHNLTVHHILSAIQIIAFRKNYSNTGKIPIALSMPVNLRKMLSTEVDSNIPGLFISIPKLNIKVSERENILEIAKNVKQVLFQKESNREFFISFNVVPKSKFPFNEQGLKKFELLCFKNPPSSMITNVGIIPSLDGFNDENPIQSISFSVAPPKDALLCSSVCSYNDKMIINYCFNIDLISEKDSLIFIERIKKQIADFLKQ